MLIFIEIKLAPTTQMMFIDLKLVPIPKGRPIERVTYLFMLVPPTSLVI